MASTALAQKEDRVVFTSEATPYSVRDVIDAAHFRGELEPHWQKLLVSVEAENRGKAAEAELDQAAVDEAVVALRYQYDLITAEETEAWLEARALNLTEFGDYFARQQWRDTFGNRITAPSLAYVAAGPELRELLTIHLTLVGELDRMATRLAWRVASRPAGDANGSESLDLEPERAAFRSRAGLEKGDAGPWLEGLGRDEAWLLEMLMMEAAFAERCARVLTAEAREREVASVRLPLTRFDVELIEFESHDAANEALMCVREDGMSMADVAEEGRYPYRRRELVLEELPDEQQQKFLSLTPGSVLEPTPRDDGFVLSRLLGKHEPKLDDPRIRARVDERILARHFAEITSARVQWRILPASSDE